METNHMKEGNNQTNQPTIYDYGEEWVRRRKSKSVYLEEKTCLYTYVSNIHTSNVKKNRDEIKIGNRLDGTKIKLAGAQSVIFVHGKMMTCFIERRRSIHFYARVSVISSVMTNDDNVYESTSWCGYCVFIMSLTIMNEMRQRLHSIMLHENNWFFLDVFSRIICVFTLLIMYHKTRCIFWVWIYEIKWWH